MPRMIRLFCFFTLHLMENDTKKHTIGQQYANMHLLFKADNLEMDNTSFGSYTQK